MLEVYQEWNILKPIIPSRSYLIPLQPIAVGTSQCESLISYIVRLANTHCLSVAVFYANILRPHVNAFKVCEGYNGKLDVVLPTKSRSIDIHSIRYWNGADSMAKGIVKVLETLTTNKNLTPLTLLPWTQILVRTFLLRPYRAWCPCCYEKWKKEKQVIYEPLSWSIRVIEVCSLHQVKLVEECPYCQKKLLPLAYNVHSGYCLHCHCWLGEDINTIDKSEDTYQIWVANSIGDLIAESAFLKALPTRKQLRQTLSEVIRILANGNASLVGRHIGISGTIIKSKSSIPRLEYLLKLCYFLRLPLKNFLLGELLPEDWKAANKIEENPTFFISIYSRLQREEMEKAINEEFLKLLPVPLKKIEKDLQFLNYRLIFKKYPQLYHKIKARRVELKEAVLKNKKNSVLLVVQKALNEEPPPRLSEVISRLGHRTDTFLEKHFPDERRKIISRYKKSKRVSKENLKNRLELFLLMNPPLSLLDIAKKEGCSRDTLRTNFPLLCKAIVVRYMEYKKQFFEERHLKFKEQVREIVTSLVTQDVYPSKRRIKEILSNPYVRCLSTLNKVLKEIRQELNISYQHLM